jgi:2-polyprenyl-3-methyl-5-hydroxy-6-metoxy-1,4-benzoquinol methylase
MTTVFRCRQCRLVYCDPRPAGDTVEEVYGSVDDYFTIAINQQRLDSYRQLAERLTAHRHGSKGLLLDVGCGRGEFVHAARQVGWKAYGIDPNRHFVEFARQRFELATVRAADLDDPSLPRGSFDAVTLNGVLEHIPDPVATVRKAAELLARGGVLFFEVPHGDVIRFAAADLVLRALRRPFTTHLSPFHPPYHLYEFSRAAVDRLAAAAGLEVLEVSCFPGTNRFPRSASLRGRMLRLAYGALVRLENATGRTYNLHAFLRAPG